MVVLSHIFDHDQDHDQDQDLNGGQECPPSVFFPAFLPSLRFFASWRESNPPTYPFEPFVPFVVNLPLLLCAL